MFVEDLFEVCYGTNLELNKLEKTTSGINFVSRTNKNNGVCAIVKPLKNVKPLDAGFITVAAGGNVLSTFVQNKPFYSGRDIFYLKPKKMLTLEEKLFYCMCINANKYKYSYGRQANKTLKKIKLPNRIPNWVKDSNMDFTYIVKSLNNKQINLSDRNWKWFKYSTVFDIEKGYYNNRPTKIGNINFISASGSNNGISTKISNNVVEKLYGGNCITVINNGESTAMAFYQKEQFTCSHDVNILRLKNKIFNPFIAMFLIPIINLEKYSFGYGRKWRYERMLDTNIKIPISAKCVIDWQFMEDYVKSLPYSSNLIS